jgi:hypothetical protein
VLTLSESFDDKSEAEESEEDAIEFLEAGKDAAVSFEFAKEPLDFISLSIKRPVIVPRIESIGFGRSHRNHSQL